MASKKQGSGCLSGCLSGILKMLALCFALSLLISWLMVDDQQNRNAGNPVNAAPALQSKMQLVDSYTEDLKVTEKLKKQGRSLTNKTEIFAFDGELTEAEIRQFCEAKKRQNAAFFWYGCVVFDKKENVTRSTSPVTALYGNQDDCLQHIRVMFTTNSVNGFGEVVWHPENIFEHKVSRIRL